MRAAGMSAWQFVRPGMYVAVLIGIFAVTVYNPLAAAARAQVAAYPTVAFRMAEAVEVERIDIQFRAQKAQAEAQHVEARPRRMGNAVHAVRQHEGAAARPERAQRHVLLRQRVDHVHAAVQPHRRELPGGVGKEARQIIEADGRDRTRGRELAAELVERHAMTGSPGALEAALKTLREATTSAIGSYKQVVAATQPGAEANG